MTNDQIANAIFDNLFSDVFPKDDGMLFLMFKHEKVKKIKEVLEKCQVQ